MASFRSREIYDALMGVKPIVAKVSKSNLQRQRRGMELLNFVRPKVKEVEFEHVKFGELNGMWAVPQEYIKGKVIFFSHGGGYMVSSTDTYTALLSRIAFQCKIKVFAHDYRLAPENPYPAALEDARSGYKFLLDEGYDSSDIIAMGDSAGGGLTLALSLYLRDHGLDLPAALILLSPWNDLTLTRETYKSKKDADPILTIKELTIASESYVGDNDPHDPYISPVFGDFHNFPPTLIHVGSEEMLLKDAMEVDARMQKQGVTSFLKVYNGLWHVWHNHDIPEAYEAIGSIGKFVQAVALSDNLPFRKVKVGSKYRHYKGRTFEVLHLARDSRNMEQLVVYRELFGEKDVWTRPLEKFLDAIEVNGEWVYRFAGLES